MSRSRPVLPPYLAARFLVSVGMQMQVVAVGWQIYTLTHSAFQLGLIGLVQFLANAGLALVSGHIIDRYPKKTVLLCAIAVECLCSAGMVLLALSETAETLPYFALVAAFGAARAFDHPAATALLPTLIATDRFPQAVAWDNLARQSAVLIGPSIGGILYPVGPAAPFAACSGALVLAFTTAAIIAAPRVVLSREPLSWHSLVSGISYITGNRLLLGVVSLDLISVLFGGATALLPIYAADILKIGPEGLGLLRSAPAVGGLAMGLVLARVTLPWPRGLVVLTTVAIYGAATVLFGVSQSLPLSLTALAIIGGADMISMVVRNTLVQIETPDALRGRVASVYGLVTGTSNQLGEFESGVAAAAFGPVASVVLGGIVTLAVAALWGWRFPALRRARLAEESA